MRAEMAKLGCPDCSLVAVSGLDWDKDLSPWPAPAVRRGEEPFAGGAAEYLAWMTGALLPAARAPAAGNPLLGGAGGVFHGGAVCGVGPGPHPCVPAGGQYVGLSVVPGHPGIPDGAAAPARPRLPLFLPGQQGEQDPEPPLWAAVEENTRAIQAFCREQGITTTFQLNPGNHFRDTAARTAAGIAWMLEQ